MESVGRAVDSDGRGTTAAPPYPLTPLPLTHTDLRCNNRGSAQRSVSHCQHIKYRAAACTCVEGAVNGERQGRQTSPPWRQQVNAALQLSLGL